MPVADGRFGVGYCRSNMECTAKARALAVKGRFVAF